MIHTVDLGLVGSEESLIRHVFTGRCWEEWREGKVFTVFLDALDECRVSVQHVAQVLVRELRNLGSLEQLRLRIACRPGAGGFSVSGNAAITGAGVTIFNAGSLYNPSSGVDGGTFGSITLSGNASLPAPSSGPYAGILIFQARDNPKALTFSGNAVQGITGTIYALAAQLTESGNAQIGSTSNPISIVVDTLSISGNAVAQLVGGNNGTVYTPAQIRSAYGINNLSWDGTGQTIAIVDAYNDPDTRLSTRSTASSG